MSNTAKTILVVDDSATIRKVVGSRLAASGFTVKLAASAEEALAALQSLTPDAIVSDVSMTGMSGYDFTRRVRANSVTTRVPILLLTAHSGVSYKVAGFEAGADDYLTKPFDPIELEMRLRALLKRRGDAADAGPRNQVIGLFSLRGGVGQTLLAVNLALNLARLSAHEVALVDLALPIGHAGVMLNLKPTHTVADLAGRPLDVIDRELVSAHLLGPSAGVRLMASPNKPADADHVTNNLVSTLLPVFSEQFRYTVVDVPHNFSDVSLACLDAATVIVLLLAPDLPSVRAAVLTLDTFETLGYPRDKTRLVLNWVFRKGGLPHKDIESALKRPIDAVIPHEPDLLSEAINRGVPISVSQPESGVGRSFDHLARQVGELQIAAVGERVKL